MKQKTSRPQCIVNTQHTKYHGYMTNNFYFQASLNLQISAELGILFRRQWRKQTGKEDTRPILT
jgi:hypothetical protein